MHPAIRSVAVINSCKISIHRNLMIRRSVLSAATTTTTVVPMEVIDGTITIDGSQGEGGGQILRNAISYANILRLPIHIHSIRAGRPRPGLREQHLRGIQIATGICGGVLQGDKLNSTEIYYVPAKYEEDADGKKERTLTAAVQTAGSVCLMLQSAIPCALFGPTPVTLYLTGGTNAIMAPQYDYWERILLPTLVEQCMLRQNQVEPSVLKHGYYPRGGGVVKVRVQPIADRLRPITLMYRGKLKNIVISVFYSGDYTEKYAKRMAYQAMVYLKARLPTVAYEIVVEHHLESTGNGAGILAIASFDCGRRLAGSAVAKYTKEKAKQVAVAAAEELYQTYMDGGCVDEWLQDQVIIYAALADGVSEISTGSITLHTLTAISIAEQIAGAKFEILKIDHLGNVSTAVNSPDTYGKNGRIAGKHLIRCHGIGFQRNAPPLNQNV
jgi:RNA 3'-terminal phosphate cyclase (ATP)